MYAYAMWISAGFQLKVIQALDKLQTQGGFRGQMLQIASPMHRQTWRQE